MRQFVATRSGPPRNQRGAFVVIVIISLAVLMGFLGLAVDGGRLYVTKTELQNAADACALAAARQLNGAPNAVELAVNAGTTVGEANKVNFQSDPIAIDADDIEFSNTLTGTYLPASAYAGGGLPTPRYARCTLPQSGIISWFMQFVGAGPATVVSGAIATLSPAQTNCGIPLAVCKLGAAPSFGLTPGQWIQSPAPAGAGLTGNFKWVDFTPPSGGASELAALIQGSGACNLSPATTVGESGVINSLADAWNSRFGLYQGPSLDGVPDHSGYGYTASNWPAMSSAYPDFKANQRPTNEPYQGSLPGYKSLNQAQLAAQGADRRVAVAPIVDCDAWAGPGGGNPTVEGWACIFMLHPFRFPTDTKYVEYLGKANELGTPCSTSGLAGGTGSIGALVPTLVR